MGKATNVRNVSVLAHQDHGATELIEALGVSKAQIYCKRDSYTCIYPSRQDAEEDPVVTVKPTSMPLYFEMTEGRLLEIKQESKGRYTRSLLGLPVNPLLTQPSNSWTCYSNRA